MEQLDKDSKNIELNRVKEDEKEVVTDDKNSENKNTFVDDNEGFINSGEMPPEEFVDEEEDAEVLTPNERKEPVKNLPPVERKITITDKNGVTYEKDMTKSRFNRFKHGKYSKFKHIYCSQCYMQERCELYKAKSICAYLPQFQKFPNFKRIKEPTNILKEMHKLLKNRWSQLQRAEFFARQDGGVIDKEVEGIRGNLFGELKTFHDMCTNRPDSVIRVEKDPLDKLFENFMKEEEADKKKAIEVKGKDLNKTEDKEEVKSLESN